VPASDIHTDRLTRLAGARLYLVCDGRPAGRGLSELLGAAIAGGVDVVQLREKDLGDEELLAVARRAREICKRHGTLFVVNDRPDLAREVFADGVHVGADDMPVAEARELVGPDMLIGLSTHAPAEIDAVDPGIVDYIGVGPIHATPTKPGRPAVGLELVRYAAAHAPVPFFAIGGIDAEHAPDVIAAGARRLCVLRAIASAEDPERAARELRELLAHPLEAELASPNRPQRSQGPRGPQRSQREDLLRATLEPLGADERPPALLVAIAVCVLLALTVIAGAATVQHLSRRGGSLPGGAFLAIVLLLLAQGMYRRRYWAVLSFEALLAFQIIVTSLALVVASTIVAAVICALSVGLGGWLFWKLVRVMGRIQAGER